MKNYNSKLVLADYNVGDVYAFYVNSINSDTLAMADEISISNYSSKITKIDDDKYAKSDGKWFNLTRVVGVITDKHEATDDRDIDYITVMFRTSDNKYVLNNYVVNFSNAFIVDKHNVHPTTVLCTV